MFDSHAHYDDTKFDHDREEVIRNAHAGGVEYILNASADMQSTFKSLELAGKFDFIYASVGIHPSEVSGANEKDIETLYKVAHENRKVVAVGEIGLDYHYEPLLKEQQKLWFIAQIELAKKLKLPVIIHDRDAHEDTLEIIKNYKAGEYGGVLHCYSGSPEMLETVLDNNLHISLGGPVTFKNAKKLIDVVKKVPFEKLLVETDCPYLAPEPFRGQRNDSGFLKYIVQKIAELKDVSFKEAEEVTTRNAINLFKI